MSEAEFKTLAKVVEGNYTCECWVKCIVLQLWRDGHGLRGNAAPLGALAGALRATADYIIVF